MRAFAAAWPDPSIVQRSAAQFGDAPPDSTDLQILQAPLAELPMPGPRNPSV
jgi:hypothetical protein